MIRTLVMAWSLTLGLLGSMVSGCQRVDDSIVRQLDVEYSRPEGEALKLDFVRPVGDGPFPVVIAIHGGGWRQGARTEYKDFQTNMARIGVATAAVQYRFAPQSKFPAPLDDVKAALKFLLDDPEQFKLDPQRVMWMGGSAGGHLALLAGLQEDDSYKTRLILNVAGPTDLRTFESLESGDAVLKQYVGRDSSELLEDLLGTTDRTADIYRQASPIEFIRADGPRIVTFHGEKDDIVPVTQGRTLHEKLKEIGAPERLFIAASGGHDIGRWAPNELTTAMLAMVEEIQKAAEPE